jgi:diacylglycerol kinase family enzyme
MAPRSRSITVVLNPGSGPGRVEAVRERVLALCRAAGKEARVMVPPSAAELRRAAIAAREADPAAIVAGGGDGTVSCVAGALAGTGIPLGVLPLGSLNHFAKDLGLPLELDAAVQVVLEGRTTNIDVGEVNGRVFVNNSSLGLYPLIVRLREQHPVRGPAKWIVALWATLREIRRQREIGVRIEVSGQLVEHRTPIVLVANNAYRAAGIAAGSRESLQDGRLAIYIVKVGARQHLLRLAWRVLRDRVQDQELEVLLAERATIDAAGVRIQLAVDGDVESFAPPLEYRIRAGALRVMVPPGSAPSDGARPPNR